VDTDWTDPDSPVSEHFKVSDILTAHLWHRLFNSSDGIDGPILAALKATVLVMEQVREALGCPLSIHCTYRSPAYNITPGVGAPMRDAHSKGMAFDFHPIGMTIQEGKDKLEPLLEQMDLRMERGTDTWIHIDRCPVIHERYFNP
jgi:hypothetical protein